MCCDWPLGGLAVAVLLSGTGRLQTNTSVENVLTSTAAPIRHWGFVCVRRRAGEGGNNVYWLRAAGGGGGGLGAADWPHLLLFLLLALSD